MEWLGKVVMCDVKYLSCDWDDLFWSFSAYFFSSKNEILTAEILRPLSGPCKVVI